MTDDDPVVAGLQRILARIDVMKKQADRLEALLDRLFARVRQIEDERGRLTASPPVPPRSH
jgi:hypothetical protein